MNGKRGRPNKAPKNPYSNPRHGGKGGNLPKYTPEEMEVKIEEYWQWCDDHKYNVTIGKTTKNLSTPPSIIGLCLHLGVERHAIQQWSTDKRYSAIISRARAHIEADIEAMSCIGLYDAKIATLRLKNHFQWTDKTEVEQTGPALTDEQLDARIKALLDQQAGGIHLVSTEPKEGSGGKP